MNDTAETAELNQGEIAQVQGLARKTLLEYGKLNDVIGSQIFSILGLHGRILYYPLNDDSVWGFVDKIAGYYFVLINTSISYDKQIFVCAHELYHIITGSQTDFIPASVLDDKDEQGKGLAINELKANRFAAEFLVEEGLLKQEMRTYKIGSGKKITPREALILSDLFMVPYKTMARRLYEIGAIKKTECESLKAENIEKLRRLYGLALPETNGQIRLDNLVELSTELYEKHLITYEKLQYLLSFAGLEPAGIGIDAPAPYIPPTDDELTDIMEE